jgi:hypothetical protein
MGVWVILFLILQKRNNNIYFKNNNNIIGNEKIQMYNNFRGNYAPKYTTQYGV